MYYEYIIKRLDNTLRASPEDVVVVRYNAASDMWRDLVWSDCWSKSIVIQLLLDTDNHINSAQFLLIKNKDKE